MFDSDGELDDGAKERRRGGGPRVAGERVIYGQRVDRELILEVRTCTTDRHNGVSGRRYRKRTHRLTHMWFFAACAGCAGGGGAAGSRRHLERDRIGAGDHEGDEPPLRSAQGEAAQMTSQKRTSSFAAVPLLASERQRCIHVSGIANG